MDGVVHQKWCFWEPILDAAVVASERDYEGEGGVDTHRERDKERQSERASEGRQFRQQIEPRRRIARKQPTTTPRRDHGSFPAQPMPRSGPKFKADGGTKNTTGPHVPKVDDLVEQLVDEDEVEPDALLGDHTAVILAQIGDPVDES